MEAWLGLAAGVVALATALVVLRTMVLSGRKTRADVAASGDATRAKVQEVHLLVNSRLEEALGKVGGLERRVDQLEASITAGGGDVPEAPG